MADENKPNDQSGSANSDYQKDNKDSNSVAHFQKIADERFRENERLRSEIEALKKSSGDDEATKLKQRLDAIEIASERKLLESEYPDIEPDLIIGKDPATIKQIVERQRKRSQEFAEKQIDVNPPSYTQNEYDAQIDIIKKSNKNPIQKAQEVLRLNRLKRGN